LEISLLSLKTICEGCGNEFTKKDLRQRVCKKNCGRRFETKRIQFVGVDGEGKGSDPSCYILFGIGDRHIENPSGLNWKDCFEFLYREYQRRGKGVAFVGFFLGYDFTQILKSLPEDRARMLLTIEGRAKRKHRVRGKEPHPVEYDGWQFDILGSKRLRIRPKTCDCKYATCGCRKASWCYLCDVGGFWQTSFLNVIDPRGWRNPIVTDEEYELIKRGKESRGVADLDDDMKTYMHLEIVALERAMTVLADGFEEIGIHLSPKQWFGPGQASAKWMRGKVKKREELIECIPKWFLDASRESYYGGWFETFVHGHIKRPVYEYDINSAYPSIIATLPCLEHGNYSRGNGRLPPLSPNALCLVYTRTESPRNSQGKSKKDIRKDIRIGTMLHRNSDGSICRPNITEGWFWLEELDAARRAGCIVKLSEESYKEWVVYEPCDCEPPFRGITDLYQVRLEQGKTSPLGKGSKLVYNSAYGKFAQSIGEPQFGNPIYASRITSGCRTQSLDAIATHPDGHSAVAMVATDAVFFLAPHPGLSVTNKLGEWDFGVRTNLTIFKPGVYWDDTTREQIRKAEKPKFKARGINAQQFAGEIWKVDFWFDDWHTANDKPIDWPTADFITEFSMITTLQALMRNKWELAGTNNPQTVYHNSDPYRKRSGIEWDNEWNVWRSEIIQREYDWTLGDYANVKSCAYKKMFGMDDPFSDETRESLGINEDGTTADMFRWMLRNDE
jgi:hypothetical protein